MAPSSQVLCEYCVEPRAAACGSAERPPVLSGECRGAATFTYDAAQKSDYPPRRQPGMRLMAPLARPVFALNHHGVLRATGEGRARRLGTRLLEVERATQ